MTSSSDTRSMRNSRAICIGGSVRVRACAPADILKSDTTGLRSLVSRMPANSQSVTIPSGAHGNWIAAVPPFGMRRLARALSRFSPIVARLGPTFPTRRG